MNGVPRGGDPYLLHVSLRVVAAVAVLLTAALVVPIVIALAADEPPDIEILDAAALEPVDAIEGRGRVELLTVDRSLELKVDLDEAVPPEGTFYEVWLVENRPGPDGVRAGQSLGPLRDHSRHVVPRGVDLDRFTTIFVTAEPLAGDPTRSDDVDFRATLDLTPD